VNSTNSKFGEYSLKFSFSPYKFIYFEKFNFLEIQFFIFIFIFLPYPWTIVVEVILKPQHKLKYFMSAPYQ
jgi:hypothetical protein